MADQKISLAVNLKDQASKGLDGLKGKLGGLATGANIATVAVLALVAGLTKLAFATAKVGDDFAKTATQVGTTATALSELTFAAQIGGAGMSEVATTLRVVSKRVNDANNGLMTSVRSFKQAGIEVRKTNGTLKTAEELLMDSADAFKALQDPVERTALAQELFGRSGTKLVPLLVMGSEKIKELREEAEILGLTFTQLEAEQAEAFQDELLRLKSTFTGLGNTIGKVLIPIFTKLFTFLKDVMLVVVPAVSKAFQGLVVVCEALVSPLIAVFEIFEKIGSVTMTGLQNMITGIRTFFNEDLSEDELDKKKTKFQELMGVLGVGAKTGDVETGDTGTEAGTKVANDFQSAMSGISTGLKNAHTEYAVSVNEMGIELGRGIHQTLQTTVSEIGTAFGAMITEGESFKKSLSKIWQDLKKVVVQQISQMIAKYLVLTALTGGTSLAAGFGLSFKKGGIVGGGLEVPSFANGGVTTAPTLAVIGDNATRREAVVPLPDGRSIPVDMQGQTQTIGQLNILPNASIDEALLAKPVQYWETLVQEKILPAMNNLGSMGETTTLAFREQR